MKSSQAILADGVRYEVVKDAAEATGICENTLYNWRRFHPGPPSVFFVKGHEFIFEAEDDDAEPVKTREPESSYSLPSYVRDAIAEIYNEFDGRLRAMAEKNKVLAGRVKMLELGVKNEG